MLGVKVRNQTIMLYLIEALLYGRLNKIKDTNDSLDILKSKSIHRGVFGSQANLG